MKLRTTNIFFTVFILIFTFCKSNTNNGKIVGTNNTIEKQILADSIKLHESFQKNDLIVYDYSSEKLKMVRENFKRINSIKKWDFIEDRKLWETGEGGIASYYFRNDSLNKIIVRRFGETFQYLAEHYLLNGELSFVFEKLFEYNRPITYDSINMIENNDNQVFDFDKSEVTEERSYFFNGKLIHQLDNQECGALITDDYLLEEQVRIKTEFKNLLKALEK